MMITEIVDRDFYLKIFGSEKRTEEVRKHFESFLIKTAKETGGVKDAQIVEHLISETFYKNEHERIWLALKFESTMNHLIKMRQI